MRKHLTMLAVLGSIAFSAGGLADESSGSHTACVHDLKFLDAAGTEIRP